MKRQIKRRQFIHTISGAVGASFMPNHWKSALSFKIVTIQDLIDFLIDGSAVKNLAKTVDTLKSGDPRQKLTGVVTTFMANSEVIKQAIQLGANLIITHEPTYYNHEDQTAWINNDAVFQAKKHLVEKQNLVIWRFHDYMHGYKPDPMSAAIIAKLGWTNYADGQQERMFILPQAMSLQTLAHQVKNRLGASTLRFVGPPDMPINKVAVLEGAWGGTMHITKMGQTPAECIVVGEIHEWETSEYVRDANSAGIKKSLIIAGHAATEEPGMEWLAKWLTPQLPDIKVFHVPGVSPFQYI